MIPKIIHHVWPGSDPFKLKYHGWRSTWMKWNPTYSMMFWRPDNIPRDLFSQRGLELVNSNLCFVMKADVMRYEILRIFGGIYVDCDMECKRSFDDLLNASTFAGEGWPRDGIPNAIIGAEPRNEIISEIVEIVSGTVAEQWDIANDPKRLYKDGKFSMNTISKSHFIRFEKIYPRDYFYPFDCIHSGDERKKLMAELKERPYAVHHWTGMEKDGWAHKDMSEQRKNGMHAL